MTYAAAAAATRNKLELNINIYGRVATYCNNL